MEPRYLPGSAERVFLVMEEGRVVPATVRSTAGASLHVEAVAISLQRRAALVAGAALTVMWRRPEAEYRLPVAFMGVTPDGWLRLAPRAEAERVQRRRHVRARVSVPLVFTDLRGEDWKGVTQDVSESGLRCRLPMSAGLAPGHVGKASFMFAHAQFVMPGEILWIGAFDEGALDVRVRFVESCDKADLIRAAVFAFQIRNRESRTS
jgi:hypothetical protein